MLWQSLQRRQGRRTQQIKIKKCWLPRFKAVRAPWKCWPKQWLHLRETKGNYLGANKSKKETKIVSGESVKMMCKGWKDILSPDVPLWIYVEWACFWIALWNLPKEKKKIKFCNSSIAERSIFINQVSEGCPQIQLCIFKNLISSDACKKYWLQLGCWYTYTVVYNTNR